MIQRKLKQSLVLVFGLAVVLAVSSCATTNDRGATRQIASDGDRGPGGPGGPGAGDHVGPGPQMGPNRGPGMGGHGGPGNGMAPIRVNNPMVFHGGPGGPGDHGGPAQRLWQQHNGWSHWNHPGYTDPSWQFDWMHITTLTCTAEDSNGVQYPVTEDGWAGQWQSQITNIEDDALDTCYNQTDPSIQNSCYLSTCTPIY